MKTKNNRQYANSLLEQPILANTEFIQDTMPTFDEPILPKISDDKLTAFSISIDLAAAQDHSYIYGDYS